MKVRKGLAVIAMGTILAAAGAAYSAPLQQSYYQNNDRQVRIAESQRERGERLIQRGKQLERMGNWRQGRGAGAAGPAAGPGSSTPRTLWHIGRASRTVTKLHLCGHNAAEVAGGLKGRACDPGYLLDVRALERTPAPLEQYWFIRWPSWQCSPSVSPVFRLSSPDHLPGLESESASVREWPCLTTSATSPLVPSDRSPVILALSWSNGIPRFLETCSAAMNCPSFLNPLSAVFRSVPGGSRLCILRRKGRVVLKTLVELRLPVGMGVMSTFCIGTNLRLFMIVTDALAVPLADGRTRTTIRPFSLGRRRITVQGYNQAC